MGRKWEVERQCGGVEFGVGLEGLELREASLVEANELVEGVGVRIEGEKVMQWYSNGKSLFVGRVEYKML